MFGAVVVLGVEVVMVVLESEGVVVEFGGGLHGGVEGGVPPILDDETTVSSIGTGLCSWSRMFWRPISIYQNQNSIQWNKLLCIKVPPIHLIIKISVNVIWGWGRP